MWAKLCIQLDNIDDFGRKLVLVQEKSQVMSNMFLVSGVFGILEEGVKKNERTGG